jgi:malonyl-CoA decarboxylase
MGRIWMHRAVETIADVGRQYFERPSSKSPLRAAKSLCVELLSGRGEASGTALAREVVALYEHMPDLDRLGFLEVLAEDYGIDAAGAVEAAGAYAGSPSEGTLSALRTAVEAPRQELLRRINTAPGGTAAIVHMRERLVLAKGDDPALCGLDEDFRHLFESWFNRGFLQFERIEWRTPAAILEKLIAYEAVHEIQGWGDLRRRLADDRRCFAFFHPALIDEPLIFVEVALTTRLSNQIGPLIDSHPDDAPDAKPTTAIFYSISNCQAGLSGISFGNLLIKQVVDALSTELPSIRHFATLSPIPGFRTWLMRQLRDEPPDFIKEDEFRMIAEPGWAEDTMRRAKLKPLLTKLCAVYLTSIDAKGRALDPVARFHLGNGASIERINWEGDVSERALAQSAGLMVNYRYAPDDIVGNHEAYAGRGEIAISSKVRGTLP